MSQLAIQVNGLSKQYRIETTRRRYDTLRDRIAESAGRLLHPRRARRSETIWALRNVSLEVERGEVVGVIGRNGAGKSTLLKILSRITAPTEGRAEIRGRVGSLLEVGTGFHPELTGRENIYLNGAVLGMKKREIDRKLDEIIGFSEIDRFIDTPVKRYSSGMSVRLAFAVAAHLEPEILLIDEVLAVGDAAFQRKCLGKMDSVAREGRTILFVSHNMAAIQNLCPRAIVLRQGQVARDGPAEEAVREYLGYLTVIADRAFEDNPERTGNGLVRFVGARVLDDRNEPVRSLIAGRPAFFEFEYENPGGLRIAQLGFKIFNARGVAVTDFDIRYTNFVVDQLGQRGTLACRVPSLPLPIGQYRVLLWISVHGRIADSIPNAIVFDVESSVFYQSARTPDVRDCAALVAHEWYHAPGGKFH